MNIEEVIPAKPGDLVVPKKARKGLIWARTSPNIDRYPGIPIEENVVLIYVCTHKLVRQLAQTNMYDLQKFKRAITFYGVVWNSSFYWISAEDAELISV